MLSQTSAPGGPGGGSGPSSWLRSSAPRPNAAVRLICFPHAGGSVGSFRRPAGLLPGTVEPTAVQPPGRQDRYAVPLTGVMTELAEQIHRELAPGFDRPTAFLGHSMGNTVVFETARLPRPRPAQPLVALFAPARKTRTSAGPPASTSTSRSGSGPSSGNSAARARSTWTTRTCGS
jgi:surfactin synthase thioesterase subunit